MAVYRIAKDSLFLTELPMYGEKRLGVMKENRLLMKKPTQNGIATPVIFTASKPPAKTSIYPLGKKHYESTDWLGNVRVTYTDKKSWQQNKFALSVNSTQDYYPFGSVMEGRNLEITNYRFGFQGQEADDEVFGKDNLWAYKYRLHDARLGRFFSVDPLADKYPYNSVYAFSENRVIDAIELEGGEKLKIAINSTPSPTGTPGSAKITITLDYMVVTTGPGAVDNHENINPVEINKLFSKGNTSFRMYSLPTKSTPGMFLSAKHDRWARKAERGSDKHRQKLKDAGVQYYIVNVEYNYTVIKGSDLITAAKWMDKDPAGRGIIMSPITKADLKSLGNIPNIGDIYGGSNIANQAFTNSSIGAIGLNEKISPLNIIYTNPVHFGTGNTYNLSVSGNEVITHEAGHNSALENVHGTGNYEYHQTGLQSNRPGQIYPTKQNTKAIINDKANRQTIIYE